MTRLNRYLAVLFLRRLMLTVFAMVTLLGVLDALGNADLLPDGAGIQGQLRYMVLRMPILFDRIVMFAILLALLMTFATLVRHNELVTLPGAGISVPGQVRALVPVVVLVSVVSAMLIDQINPIAKGALEDWLGTSAVRHNRLKPQKLWLSDTDFLVEVNGVADDKLSGLTLFEVDDDDAIVVVTHADTAEPRPGGWALQGVTQLRFDGQDVAPRQFWPTGQTLRTMRILLAEPRDLALTDLYRLARMKGAGSQPSSAYIVWLLDRLFRPLVAIGFLLLAVPIMQRYGRRDSSDLALSMGVTAGFVFMLADGVTKTLAESGSIGPMAAVVIPLSFLWLIGAWLTLGRRRLS